jgi:poly [ADP-ribose] polymerase
MDSTQKISDLTDSALITAPNRKYLEFRISVANTTRGHNDMVTMDMKPSGNFVYKEGPIGDTIIAPGHITRRVLPGALWDETYRKVLSRGYALAGQQKRETKDITTEDTGTTEESPIEDEAIRNFMAGLIGTAAVTMSKMFTVKVTDISDEHIEAATKILNQLWESKDTISVASFNALLDKLHFAVPRRIPNVRLDHIASKAQIQEKLQKEQDIFDFMVSNVYAARHGDNSLIKVVREKPPTILEKHSCEMWQPSKEDEEFVRELMGSSASRISKIFCCKNKETEKKEIEYKKVHKLGEFAEKEWQFKTPQGSSKNGISYLFHGSRDCNWSSIIFNGIMIPVTATNGRAFGNGAYFADLAQKSIGYTSVSGSYWAGGTGGRGILGIYEVCTGEVYDIYGEGKGVPNDWADLQAKHPGADCLWAMSKRNNGTSYLMNEEIIVYKPEQCTVKYIVEIK